MRGLPTPANGEQLCQAPPCPPGLRGSLQSSQQTRAEAIATGLGWLGTDPLRGPWASVRVLSEGHFTAGVGAPGLWAGISDRSARWAAQSRFATRQAEDKLPPP